jgi:hypothetical protein
LRGKIGGLLASILQIREDARQFGGASREGTFSALAQLAIEFSEGANADCHDVTLITAKSVPKASR